MTNPFFWLDSHAAIIGTSDSGKTWTAKWAVEELLRQRRHVLMWDPLGVWYGLRSSRDGKSAGFDIPIFGGRHGDVPIAAGDGAAIARIITEQRVSAIIDASLLTSGFDQRRFARDLVAGLRRRRDRDNFHFVVDEADELVPEKTRDDIGFALQEDMLWIAKKGRSSGWVQLIITQRTADIAKSSLSMSQTIVAHQLVSPQDQKPFLDWIRTRGTKAEREEIERNLAELPRGQRYLYSPRAKVLTLETTPAITTFDSSRTPPPGQRRREPRTLAQLDVSAIAAALKPPAATAGSRAADREADAIEFGLNAARLRTDLDLANARVAELERQVDEAENRGRNIGIGIGLTRARAAIDAVRVTNIEEPSARKGGEVMSPATSASEAGRAARSGTERGAGLTTTDASAPAPTGAGASTLPPAQQAILDRLAWGCAAFRRPALTKQVLAILLGTHQRTKSYLNNLGALRSAGLLDYPGPSSVALTEAGADITARPDLAGAPLQDLRREVHNWLPPAQARILNEAFGAWPDRLDRDALAATLGVHPRTKSLLNNIGRLKGLGLLTAPTAATLQAAGFLFGDE